MKKHKEVETQDNHLIKDTLRSDEPETPSGAKLVQFNVKEVPEDVVAEFDRRAKNCRMTRSEYFLEVFDRSYKAYTEIRHLSDRKARRHDEELAKQKNKKKVLDKKG